MTQETEREKLIKSLRIKADMILMGERIGWGSETELMYQAADAVELMYQAADALEALHGQARASLDKVEVESITKHPQWLALRKEEWEAEQILGKALGYPWYKDDQKNFPGCNESDGVCTGDHTLVTLAMEASRHIASLSAKPVEVGNTELAALAVEAFNKTEKPENHIGLCAGYRISQVILSRYNVTKKEEV